MCWITPEGVVPEVRDMNFDGSLICSDSVKLLHNCFKAAVALTHML